MSDAAFITAKLKEVRRRQFLVLSLHCMSIALLGFVFWRVLCAVGIFHLDGPSIIIQLASGAVLLFAALIVSLFRMPSWKETAKLIDKTLGLQQRVETSWECIPPREEMDALLLMDTSQRIATIRPADVVPMQFGRTTGVLFIACLLVMAVLSVIWILGGRNHVYIRESTDTEQTVVGSPPQPKSSPKAIPPASQANNPAKSRISVAPDSDSTTGRGSAQAGLKQGQESFPGQVRLQPAQGLPAVTIPDKGDAGRQAAFSTAPASSKPGSGSKSEVNTQGPEAGKIGTSAGESSPSSSGTAGADAASRPNAGTASIRKAVKENSGQAGTLALSEAKATTAGLLSSRQAGPILRTRPMTGNDAAPLAAYARDYPAWWNAAEQALQKEKIPPGFKKYIVDYFRAIHP